MLIALLRTLKERLRRPQALRSELPRASGDVTTSSSKVEAHGAPEGFAASQQALREGRFEAAIERLERIVTDHPLHVPSLINLGFALAETSRHNHAIETLRAALAHDPHSADAHYLLGSSLMAQGDPGHAVRHFQAAAELQPDLVAAHRDLAKSLHLTSRHAEACEVLEQALIAWPEAADLHYFLGNIQLHQHEAEAALQSYQAALRIAPGDASTHSNTAPAYLAIGEYGLAAAAARSALNIDPLLHSARSNLLLALSSSPDCLTEEYLAEASKYGKVVMASATAIGAAPGASRDLANVHRPLHVGFVSGDFRSHPVGYFLESLMAAWNADHMTAYAYSNHRGTDALTTRLKTCFAQWADISELDDAAAAARIRSDAIDVLVDLSGHTPDNRLPMFAMRPAPLQLNWLGYWASTGLPAIDAVITDEISLPKMAIGQFTERIAYLPVTRLCFTPPSQLDAMSFGGLSMPPAKATGYITFGSYQRVTKINAATLTLWAAVLKGVAGSRLRLQSAKLTSEPARSAMLAKLQAHGVDTQRVDLADATSRALYFESHSAVDIILDTTPHTGATTTCEALWMGVPTVTLAGTTMLSRQGASLLTAAGLADWVAHDEASFIEMAMKHAADLPALVRCRMQLRERLLASPLTDARAFAQSFQALVSSLVDDASTRELDGTSFNLN